MAYDHFIETFFALSLFINAALFVPQAMCLFAKKDSTEISFITFFGFWLIQLVTSLHGFIRQDWLLAFGTLLSMVTCGCVVWLIVWYRIKNKNSQLSYANQPGRHR